MENSFSLCFTALDSGGLHSLASNSSKSLISFIFQNDSFASFYAIVANEKRLTAEFYRSFLKMAELHSVYIRNFG